MEENDAQERHASYARSGETTTTDSSPPQPGRPAGDFNNFETFQLFRSYLDTQMQSLRQDIKSDRDSIVSSFNAKLKKTNTYKFKFDGNEKNFLFNCDILDDLEQLETIVKRECEKSLVQNIKAKLEERNKLIKLADSSPAGWTTVSEYTTNDLASDSGDERKIRSAENRALKKLKLSRSTKNFSQNAKRNTFSMLHNITDTTPVYEEQTRFRGRRQFPSTSANYRFTPYTKSFSTYADKRAPGINDLCFRCGGRGHWSRDCEIKPETNSQSKGKF